jgi:hypothetical protein
MKVADVTWYVRAPRFRGRSLQRIRSFQTPDASAIPLPDWNDSGLWYFLSILSYTC